MLLSKITLPGIFFNQITDKLFLDKTTYDEQKLLKEINEKNECTILNSSIDSSKINEKLKSSPLIIDNINISKIHIYFNNENLCPSIIIDNITIDLIKNNNINQNNNINIIKNEENNINNFDMGTLSNALYNLLISIKNIKIKIKENNNILYSLLINEINYQNNTDNDEINEKEKSNYLFCNNKIINIGGLVLKEGYNESDEIFFNNDEKCNKVNFYTNPQILMVIYNKIQIDITHNYQNQKLLINNINCDNIFIECIMNITQIKNLIKFNQNFLIDIKIKKDIQNMNKNVINNNKDNKEFDLFGFKINILEININFNYSYFIFLNSEQNINKFWMFYQNYFDKYYTMSIDQKKNIDISKKNNDNKIINLIQKHFCYFDKEYYLIFMNQPKLFINNNNCNNNNILLTTPSLLFKLIQPNKISEKINVIIIDNKSNNKGEYIDNEQSFNDLFLPYYKKVIQYGYYIHNISVISNLEIGNKEILFNDIEFDIDSFLMFNILNFYKILFSNTNDHINKDINNINDNNNTEFNYIIKGNRINFNLMINKNWIDYIKEKKALNNCFDSYYYTEKICISLENIKFNINDTYQKTLLNLCYNKLYVFFIMKNIIYPLLYVLDNKDNNYNSSKQVNNNIIISKINNSNFDINSIIKYIVNFDKVYFFINPILLSYYIIQYLKIFYYTFDIFRHFKNKTKFKNIDENLNIDLISAEFEYEMNKFGNNLIKLLIKNIKNIEINIEEINFIFFCLLSINNIKIDLKSIFDKNENIFKIILNPIMILKLKECYYKNNKIKISNLFLIVKAKNENFNREELIYKEIIGNIDINNENYEFIIYKSKTESNLLEGELKIEEKKGNIKLELNMEDIVFCPISNRFNDIVSNIEKGITKYTKMNSYLFGNYPFINGKTDLINYEKIIKNSHFYINSNLNNEIKYKIKLKCSKLFLDLYSTNKNTYFYDRNMFENITEKNKMRLILEIDDISMEYIHEQKINLSLQKINSAFLKDLRISHSSCSLLIDEFANINYTKINISNENSTNSLCIVEVKNEDNLNLKTKINKRMTHASIIANIGFVPIIECEKGITININLNNSKIFNNISINTNNEIIVKDINLKLCKDSLKDIIYFGKKLPHDIQSLINLKSAFKDDVEKIIIEKDVLSSNYLKDQLKRKENDTGSCIELRSVNTSHKQQKNNKMFNRLLNPSYENNHDYSSNKSNDRDDNNVIISNYMIAEEVYRNKNNKKTFKMNLQINSINIYLYDGEDFNFQGNHTLIVFYNSSMTGEKSNQENIIKHNDRNINNNILISIKDLKCKYSKKNNEIEMNILLNTLIIEDNIEKSIYKKLLSHFDFQNDKNIFLNSKVKIIKEINGNSISDIDALIELTPIAIYLDQITLDFMVNFFNILKYLLKDEEENDEDDLFTNESNKKLNNRIIQNHEDIMNINNEDNDFNSNEQVLDQEISTINQFQSDNIFKSILRLDKLYINSLVINPFFISFNYNPKEINSSEEEEFESLNKNNEPNLRYEKILEYLKKISLHEFILNFKKFDNHKDKNQIKCKNILKELYDYYYKDIVNYNSFNNYLKALPVVNKFCSIFEGFYNIWNKTIDHEKNNNTLEEGFVYGTQDLVVNTTCSILSIGESITGFLGKKLNLDNNINSNDGIIKKMKKKINENLCKKEEYYFK